MKIIYLALAGIAMASNVLACRPNGEIVDYECGTDGVTYQNAGFRVCAVYPWGSIGLACKGRCPCAPDEGNVCDDIFCTTDYVPVCGSDGVTYSNDCELGRAACNDPSIVQIKFGECPSLEPCAGFAGLACPDGFTCIDVPNDGCDPLNGGSDCIGACVPNAQELLQACDDIFCTTDYVPVCGSNGVTYGNDCELGRAACNDPSIRQVRDGVCPSCDDIFCTTDYVPVCGSDGVTYGNDCELGRAACYDPSIRQVRAGECSSDGNNSTQA